MFSSNYSKNNYSISAQYFKPTGELFFKQEEGTSYKIERLHSDQYVQIKTNYYPFIKTKFSASYENYGQYVFSTSIKQTIDKYKFSVEFKRSDRFIELVGQTDIGNNQLLIPIGYSSIFASLETNHSKLTYLNKAFDQTINRSIREYSNAGRQIDFQFESKSYDTKVQYSLTNLTIKAREANQVFLKLDNLETELFSIEKHFHLKRWQFEFVLSIFYKSFNW